MDKFYDAKTVEKATLAALKDFQLETVNRVDALFRGGQRRVLVADEVGLGKTVVARGVIAKTACLRREEHDDLFKVAYICSNQNIANQNVQKLRVSDEVQLDEDVTQTRLSMQHLKIAQQNYDENAKRRFVLIIPLTPETSFNVKSGWGTGAERALMCVVLCRMPEYAQYAVSLEANLKKGIQRVDRWNDLLSEYKTAVNKAYDKSGGRYPVDFCDQLRKSQVKDLDRLVRQVAGELPVDKATEGDPIQNLRFLFATESARMMQPDLVIMDEFQRFRSLISSNEESEEGIIASEFLSGKHDDEHQKTRVLLLSATPYKLYSTPGEISECERDDQYSEFIELLDFLFEGRAPEVKRVWSDYTKELQEFKGVSGALLRAKTAAEDRLVEGMCRTERVSVMDTGDYISDERSRNPISVFEGDVSSYIQIVKFFREIGLNVTLPVDYVKSCPYLLSYLRGYTIRDKMDDVFRGNNKKKVLLARQGKTMCLSRARIRRFDALEKTNGRLEVLKNVAFQSQAERFIWVPPTLPYYQTQGAYKDAYVDENYFSKVLVFSAWEMVPRMISTLLSYEAERLTTGKLCRSIENRELGRVNYFSKNRYPPPRLRFAIDYADDPSGKAKSMTLFSLIYPSESLRRLYVPLRCYNERMSLKDIEREIAEKVAELLRSLTHYVDPDDGREDSAWYYLAPMLLDGVEHALSWAETLKARLETPSDEDAPDSQRRIKGALANCESLISLLSNPGAIRLGRQPSDLVETIVNMVLGSPAVCVSRGWRDGDADLAGTEIARGFFKRFNQTESIAILELAYGRRDDDYWKDVLRYCKDGCFQAMFDEYYSVVSEEVAFVSGEKRGKQILSRMCAALDFRSVPYRVDTAESLYESVYREKGADISMPMRTHYAVGFIKGKGDVGEASHRKDVIRRSFNSPFRPFVLASTSIGQEGLDFHPYCRKIFHWNLPTNPIDLEQREGRINRYKCLAVRENIALKYGKALTFKENVWAEMYAAALAGEKSENVSELVPFWCFGKDQRVKIERIVPKYPCSRDEAAYQRLITILSLYRLSMGQPRQEELLEHVMKDVPESERAQLKRLFIDLSPFSKRHGSKEPGQLNDDHVMAQSVLTISPAADLPRA